MNPYYEADKLGWTMISVDEPGLYYEYNTLCFWKTPAGLVYSASDSGCSCPTPFENYCGNTGKEIEAQLERIPDAEYGKSILRSWSNGFSEYRTMLPLAELQQTEREIENLFK